MATTIDESKRNARLMGILYGVISAGERLRGPGVLDIGRAVRKMGERLRGVGATCSPALARLARTGEQCGKLARTGEQCGGRAIARPSFHPQKNHPKNYHGGGVLPRATMRATT